MIEINLLPPQYRAVERTPLPVFLGLLAGIVLVAAAFVFYVAGIRQTTELKGKRDVAKADLAKARDAAREFDELNKKINEHNQRIGTVLKIVESKIPWSIKLEQLVGILPRSVWFDRLELERRADGKGEIKLQVNARGTAPKTVPELKQRLRSDTNFFYHFDALLVREVLVKQTPPDVIEPEYLSFEMTLPLRAEVLGATTKKAPAGRR